MLVKLKQLEHKYLQIPHKDCIENMTSKQEKHNSKNQWTTISDLEITPNW